MFFKAPRFQGLSPGLLINTTNVRSAGVVRSEAEPLGEIAVSVPAGDAVAVGVH